MTARRESVKNAPLLIDVINYEVGLESRFESVFGMDSLHSLLICTEYTFAYCAFEIQPWNPVQQASILQFIVCGVTMSSILLWLWAVSKCRYLFERLKNL